MQKDKCHFCPSSLSWYREQVSSHRYDRNTSFVLNSTVNSTSLFVVCFICKVLKCLEKNIVIFFFTNMQETLKAELCLDPFINKSVLNNVFAHAVWLCVQWLFSGHLLNAQGGNCTFMLYPYFSFEFLCTPSFSLV